MWSFKNNMKMLCFTNTRSIQKKSNNEMCDEASVYFITVCKFYILYIEEDSFQVEYDMEIIEYKLILILTLNKKLSHSLLVLFL